METNCGGVCTYMRDWGRERERERIGGEEEEMLKDGKNKGAG